VLNTTNGKTERIGRILQMHANHREEREEIGAGEIAAAVGLKFTTTGDTIAVNSAPIVLERMTFPDPVISVAIEPRTKADQDKLATALQRLAEEDPTFRVSSDEETGQTLIAGMGELHLEIIVDRLMREFNVDANVGRPQVAYRETVSNPVQKIEGRFVRQTGGRGQYGHAVINMEPADPGDGYEFMDKIGQTVFLSATPGAFELEKSTRVVEQVVRPTGLVDPEVVVKPTKGQIDDLMAQDEDRVGRGEDKLALVTHLGPERCVVIKADQDPDRVEEAVWKAVSERLPKLVKDSKSAKAAAAAEERRRAADVS